MKMNKAARLILCTLVLLSPILPAQGEKKPDPKQEEILKLCREIQNRLKQIDDVLLGTSPDPEKENKTAKAQLGKAKGDQEKVVQAIDKILESMPKKKNNSGSQSKKPKDDKEKKPQDKPKPREQEKRPDQIKQKKDPKESKKPKQTEETAADKPENKEGKKPPENPQGKTPPNVGNDVWGRLPAWVKNLFRKGKEPVLPEKYRALWRAFQKRDREKR